MVLVFRALLPVIKSQYCAAVKVNEPQCTFPVVLFLAAVVVWVQKRCVWVIFSERDISTLQIFV